MAKKSHNDDDPKKINLALQGGGSHGAFTWGVLDALLEDGRVDIEAISATSAGSMNAVMLLHGLELGGPEKARAMMRQFWERISHASSVFNPAQSEAVDKISSFNPYLGSLMRWSINPSAAYGAMTAWSSALSPYQFNPLDINPLRDIIEELVDFGKVQTCSQAKLFITATNVKTGQPRVFPAEEITIDVVMASATLPSIYKAVKIGNEYYWDGGYMGNPSLWPLFYKAVTKDLLIVHVNPITRKDLPKDSLTIENRLNEITFNASLLHELRAIAFVQKLLAEDMLKEEYRPLYKDVRLHAIRAEKAMQNLLVASKFDTSWPFLQRLMRLGRQHGFSWLNKHFDKVGVQSSIDIRKDYLSKD
jgi:NTE family protein